MSHVLFQGSIGVLGLGYVGLPLAVALAQHFPTTGFDINAIRVKELKEGVDRTREVETSQLESTNLKLTSNAEDLFGHSLFIVTVPTPVLSGWIPDFSFLEGACQIVGKKMAPGAIVVFESTVYPGVTQEICGPLLEKISGLIAGVDFFLGYSPERVNPGDRDHTLEKMTKVVAGQTPYVEQILQEVYGRLNHGQIFVAKSIAVAEAAKAIENAQRDINVAFINEITMLTARLGLSVYDVLEAAQSKWNFLPFRPGFVGGHCISVDPYYLAFCARKVGITPQIILAGRQINEAMGGVIASFILEKVGSGKKMLVLGLTFKENVPDLRNTKVMNLVMALQDHSSVEVHDPLADPEEAKNLYGISLKPTLEGQYDAVIGAVSHEFYRALTLLDLQKLLLPGGLVADIKGMWRSLRDSFPMNSTGHRYWTL